ncbi:glycosyltransferase [Verrucomicrobiota bacterium]
MHFFIVTPSFNQVDYLKHCVLSVADQAGENVRIHHHIQDGGSTDGTVDWLRQYDAEISSQQSAVSSDLGSPFSGVCHGYTFSYSSESDAGMYDALNRGIDQCEDALRNASPSTQTSDCIFAWLNCDEQYLPGALEKVATFFAEHSAVDFAYGDALNVDPSGALLTYRKNPPLRRAYVLADHLYTQSAAMFFRARVFAADFRFDTRWRAVSDCDLVCRMLRQGFVAGPLRQYLSVFTMTGKNLSVLDAGRRELTDFRREQPLLARLMRWPLNGCRFVEKALRGGYVHHGSLEYEVYADDSAVRRTFSAKRPSSRFRWE